MKKMVIAVFGLFVFLLFFLVFKTFTVSKVCGWKGVGKDWPCLCLGLKQTSIESNKLLSADGNIETYYCTGLNLTCSEFALENFYSDNLQKPISKSVGFRELS